MVPSTSDDKTAIYDPHDYDEVPMDEGAVLSRPPAESAVPGPVPDRIIEAEPEDDGVYSVVRASLQHTHNTNPHTVLILQKACS